MRGVCDRFLPAPYVSGRTIAEVWPKALSCIVATAHWRQLCGDPHIVTDQRGDETYEVEGLQVVITDPLRGMIPKLPTAPGVTAWGDKARLDEYFETEIMSIDRKGFDYVYGEWLVPGLLHAIEVLKNDPTTRRAFIPVGDADDYKKSSPPCLRGCWLSIRNGVLNWSDHFRSHDYAGAAATNWYGLILAQAEAANELGVRVGVHRCLSESAHIRIKDDLWWVEKVIS